MTRDQARARCSNPNLIGSTDRYAIVHVSGRVIEGRREHKSAVKLRTQLNEQAREEGFWFSYFIQPILEPAR